MINKDNANIDFFSNDDAGISLKEFLICEANAFAEKNGFSSVKGMAQWLSFEMAFSIGDFLAHANEQGMKADYNNTRDRLKSSLRELDMREVQAGNRKPIDKAAVFAKYFNQVVKSAPRFIEDNQISHIRSLKELGLTENNSIQLDENGKFVITVSESALHKERDTEKSTQNHSINPSDGKIERSEGENGVMGEYLKKYEDLYRNNVHEFKSNLDSFFEEYSNKLKSEEGKMELREELMRQPLRRIENIQERKAYSKCFVDEYAQNIQDKENSFTRIGCEMIASKYTVEQIEKNPNLHAFENGKITKDYAEFVKSNSEYVKERDQNLVNSVNAQGRDPSFKEIATHNANRQIQTNFDVGSYREKNITVEQSNER